MTMNTFKPERIKPGVREGILERIGHLGPRTHVSSEQARTYGRRRVVAALAGVASIVAFGLGIDTLLSPNQADAERYKEKIEACASTLTGREVEIGTDPSNGRSLVAYADSDEVKVCQTTGGDPERAEQLLK